MQNPSSRDLEQEVAALRHARQRSSETGPGSIPLDPDLPPNGAGGSASAGGYWDNFNSAPQRRPSARLRQQNNDDSNGSQEADDVPDDPSHLFWVPAHLHPEIAPGEFRAFLREHTAASPDGTTPLGRSLSRSSSLGRKKSLLSKQYTPRANDHVEDERPPVSVKRNRSSIYSTAGPQLTIGDLQKLEQLAEEAAASDDPSKLRKVLRRSLSLNVAPSFIDQIDDIPSTVDEADEPIIVPRPGQILRRTARTKIRKPGLAGDGGGHRFGPSRRGGRAGGKGDADLASDSGHESASEHRHSVDKPYEPNDRPSSYADIFDAYGDRRDSMVSASSSAEDDDLASSQSHSTAPTSAPQSKSHEGSGQRPISPPPATLAEGPISPPRAQPTVRRVSPPLQPEQPQPQYQPEPQHHPQLHHPSPQRHGHLEVPGQHEQRVPNRSPSPGSTSDAGPGRTPQQPSTSPEPFRRSPSAPPQTGATDPSPSAYAPPIPSPAPSIKSTKSEKGREKEKKGLLKGMWGGEKDKKKEKDTGFFGSLFGGGKKKQEEPESKGGLLSGAGPAAAAALLGASKSSKNQMRPPSPNLTNNYSRYPIHVERAVYRLSHIKLANPRRPLYEQVLISNLMFWYLGVINKVTPPTPATNNGQVTTGTQNSEGGAGSGEDRENAERDRQEREKAEMEEKERMERERLEREQRESREKEQRERAEKEGKKRGTLVKNVTPPGGQQRRAEMPVRGPQYDVQHRIMEQEQGNPYGRGPPAMGRGPPGDYGPPRGGPPYPPQQRGPPQPGQYPPNQGFNQQQPGNYQQFSPSLPPGAMPPPSNVPPEQWLGSATNSRESPYAAATSGPGRSRSPPQQQKSPPPGGGRSPTANAGGPPPNYGRPSSAGGPVAGGQWGGAPQPQRRGPSPQPPPAGERRRRNSSGGDDVPLGQWQQQQQQQQQQQYRGGPVVR